MKKRIFLASLAVSLAALLPASKVAQAKQPEPTRDPQLAQPKPSATLKEDFVLFRSDGQPFETAYHASHRSHMSHRSHSSHYSGY